MTAGLGELIRLALDEDLGDDGDVTSAATVPATAHATARLVARQAGTLAGLDAARDVFVAVDARVAFTPLVADGAAVERGTALAEVSGPARALLAAERTALNLLTHLSGVATETARYVAAVDDTGCAIRDTRKTMPGLRTVEKAAVAAGGGTNHRSGLYDGLLVKDNHVAAAGGVAEATRRALEAAGGRPVQVEVDDLDQLGEALGAGATSLLLDNFSLDQLARAVQQCRDADVPVFCEASGGIDLGTVRAVAETGVDAVAVGALTHSAPALDIGLDSVDRGA